jgi:hypothetical protein
VGLAEITKTHIGVDDGETEFEVKYRTRALKSQPTIRELRRIPILNQASFLKSGPASTVFPLSSEQAELLLRRIYAKNPELDVVWPDVDLNGFGVRDIDLDVSVREGKPKRVFHLRYERKREIIEAKKQDALRKNGGLVCEVCTFNFEDVYGSRGREFCEVHHIRPLSDVQTETQTRLDDLAIVCSNCHRMIHREPWIEIDQLKRYLQRSR